eukprot:6197113-Pleurochrysis_carterae.AAC.2
MCIHRQTRTQTDGCAGSDCTDCAGVWALRRAHADASQRTRGSGAEPKAGRAPELAHASIVPQAPSQGEVRAHARGGRCPSMTGPARLGQ